MIEIIGIISTASVLIPILFLFSKKFNRTTAGLFIALYITICTGIEITCRILIRFEKNTLRLDNVFSLLELLILGALVSSWNEKQNQIKYQYLLLLGFGGIAAFYQLHLGLNVIVPALKIAYSLVLIGICFLYIFNGKKLFDTENLTKTIFTLAILFYFLSNSIIFSFSGYLLAESNKQYWIYYAIIHAAVNIIYNISIALSILKWKRN